jgi:hypothetical protein
LSDHARLAREIEQAYEWMVGQAGDARSVETQEVGEGKGRPGGSKL